MTRQFKIGLSVWSAVAICVIVGISGYVSMRGLLEANRWVTHTRIVGETLQRVLSLHQDAETGQRGYILTGDPRFLEPYQSSIGSIRGAIAEIKSLTSDNPAQQESVVALMARSEENLASLRSAIEVRDQAGLEAAAKVIARAQGKKSMDDLRALIAIMQDREQLLLTARNQEADLRAKRFMVAIALWLPLLSILAILITRRPKGSPLVAERAPAPSVRAKVMRYSFALLTVLTATLLRWWWGGKFQYLPPFITYFPAVLIVAAVAGSGPGLLATILCTLTAAFMFMPPIYSFAVSSPNDLMLVAIFTGTNVFACVLTGRLQQSRWAAGVARQSELRFRTMVDSIPQLAWTARADGFIDWYNQRWYEYTGTTPKDMEGWGWQAVHDPATLPAVMTRWQKSIASGEPFDMTFPLRAADGRFRSFLTRVNPVKDADGRVVQWFGTNTDVEELKLAELTHTRLAAIVESSDDAILSKSLDGTIQTWNAAAERLFGYKAGEIIGQSILRLLPADRVAEEADIIARLRRGEACDHIETVRVARDGRRINVSVTISPLRNADGVVIGASKIVRDITERVQTSEALAAAMRVAEEAKNAAEEANQTKDRFITILSHELRTPLNPVMLIVSMLAADPQFDEETREQLEIIRRNVEIETRLIDDLLDLTSIDLGSIKLHRRLVELGAILHGVAESCRRETREKAVEMTVDVPATPLWVDGDATRLRQIFWNVIKNAIKFTPEGGAVGVRGRGGSDGFAHVQVIDHGVGISPARLEAIFTAFEHADGSVTRKFGGAGLGLALAKTMVELHGGTIAAHSKGDGKGATFEVRLPLAKVETTTATNAEPTGAASEENAPAAMRILLVEDHLDTARTLGKLLRHEGYEVDHAADVATALNLLSQRKFDLLVSDLGLPDGNGWDIMRGLREKGSSLPGIAISGYGRDADLKRSLEVGYSAHLTKPINMDVLITRLRELAA